MPLLFIFKSPARRNSLAEKVLFSLFIPTRDSKKNKKKNEEIKNERA